MGTSFHEQAALKAVNERMQDPQWSEVLNDACLKLNTGHYSKPYVDMILQKSWHRGRYYDLCDTVMFVEVHAAICLGKVTICEIEVGHSPLSDRNEEMNNKLLGHLPAPFSAEFQGGAGDNDGVLKWSESIKFGHIKADGEEITTIMEPFRAPLEVGYTLASRTWLHLKSERFLARWPYESNFIWLFYVIDWDLWQMPFPYRRRLIWKQMEMAL